MRQCSRSLVIAGTVGALLLGLAACGSGGLEKRALGCAESTRVLVEASDDVEPVPLGPDVQPEPVTPSPALHFVESVGVAIHMTYDNTPYVDHDKVLEVLKESGIRHVRDGHVPGAEELQGEFLTRLAEQGDCAQMLLGGGGAEVTEEELDRSVELLASNADAISAVEGPNELDLSDLEDWESVVRDYQEHIVEEVRQTEALEEVPIVGPSVGSPRSFEEAGDLSGLMDIGNLHPYPAGKPPELEALDLHLEALPEMAGDSPALVSETGYHDAVPNETGQRGVPEDVAGAYQPRLLLDAFSRSIVRTYIYELVDEFPDPEGDDDQASFGLYRRDWSPKPAAEAVTGLLALLSDGTDTSTPEDLEVAVRAPEGSGVRALLLGKEEGAWLALWSEASLWDPQNRERLKPPDVEVTLLLGETRDVAVHRPVTGLEAVSEHLGTTSVDVAVPADPLLIRLTP